MPLKPDRIKVDLQKVKDYLKIEYNRDDAMIYDLVKVAKEQADLFLQNDFMVEDVDTGEMIEDDVPYTVTMAIYRMVGAWYEHRVAGIESKTVGGIRYEIGEMPTEARTLLAPLRKLVGT